jgi:hypothetical protein
MILDGPNYSYGPIEIASLTHAREKAGGVSDGAAEHATEPIDSVLRRIMFHVGRHPLLHWAIDFLF